MLSPLGHIRVVGDGQSPGLNLFWAENEMHICTCPQPRLATGVAGACGYTSAGREIIFNTPNKPSTSSGQDLRVAYQHRVALTTQSSIEINRQRYIVGLPVRI